MCCSLTAAADDAMKVSTLAAAVAVLPFALAAPSAKPIILRDLAVPRFFGAAANTTFLFNDKNYTKVISTQVSEVIAKLSSVMFTCMRQFSIFTPENESKQKTFLAAEDLLTDCIQ